MKGSIITSLCAVLLVSPFVIAAQNFPETCTNGLTPHFPSLLPTAIDSECGLEGTSTAAASEKSQNDGKNNFCADTSSPATVNLSKLKSLQKSAASQEKKKKFTPGQPPPDRSFLTTLGEGSAVVFEGYVFAARQEGKESVNCGDTPPNLPASYDIHISLLAKPRKTKSTDPQAKRDKEECGGFVAEMIPHHRPSQWNQCSVESLAASGLRVRVTGQQFFDGSHLPCKSGEAAAGDPRRISLWEIHPIYSFEVCPSGKCSSGGWQPLETFAAGNAACEQSNGGSPD